MDWFRSYHGAPTDKKWLVIARAAGTDPGVVAAVWWALMDHASQAHPRGSVESFDVESLAAFYGWSEETIAAVLEALRKKGLIGADETLRNWTKRNPSDYSTERVRKHRMKRGETDGNGGKHRTERTEEIEERTTNNSGGRLNVDNSTPGVEHTLGSVALEAHEVLGMGQWGDELSAKFNDTKRTIRTQWMAGGVSLDSIHRAIHGLRTMIEAEEVDWLKDRKGKPVDGIHVLLKSAVVQGPDGSQMRPLFQLAQEAYARDAPIRRTVSTGPERIHVPFAALGSSA